MRTIVTGAASGIGRSVARLLLADPDSNVVLVDRDERGLAELARELGPRAHTLVADLASADCGQVIVAHSLAVMDGVDALVSNAGILPRGGLYEATVEQFEAAFAVNTRATWLLAQAAYPHIRDRGGAIVATASMAASDPTPGCAFYAPSKAALVMLMRQLANEWGPDNIRCNTVSPGPTLTGLNSNTFADPTKRAARESSIPLRRMAMPEDIARAIVFLLSDAASQITGVNLPVDGGLTTTLMSAGMAKP